MMLRLVREPSINQTTFGVLFVDERFESFMLEDELREKPGRPVSEWKISGETAIPAGRYQIVITDSVRFQRKLPLLVGVSGFAGIRIHPGNRHSDTEGCLLPGRWRDAAAVSGSREAFEALFAKISAALTRGDQVWITIENPASRAVAA